MNKPIPFGKYYLLDRINAGGMAEVFRAKAFGVEGFERIVAVKRILPSIAEDTEFIGMFIDEAKLAVQLNHANIAQIFDLGKVGESYFIALEYVHGKDLRAIFDLSRSRGEPLPIELSCYVVMKICEGLDYAHNKRDASGRPLELVHRDVSPQNILISFDGEPKLIDFGIARAAGKAGRTRTGILKGKFGYLSPEQVRGDPVDRRSDVFGMGIVLYELLTGERLFAADTEFATVEKVRQGEIPPPRARNSEIDETLEAIVLKALARDVSERYQSAMELHDALQRFLRARGESFGRRELSAWMRQHFPADAAGDQEAVGDLRDLEALASENTDVAPTFDPAEPNAVNRDSRDKPKKQGTMLGMPAVIPPPDAPPNRSGRTAPPPPPRSGGGAPSVPPRPPTSMAPPARSVPPPPPRTVPPGQKSAPPAPPPASNSSPPSFGGPTTGTIPSMGARAPSAPPPGASRSVPPPPGPSYASTPPPGSAVAAARVDVPPSGTVLNMDWDDEELSTQIYDRPDDHTGGYAPVQGGYDMGPGMDQGQAGVPTYVPPQGYGHDMGGVQVAPGAYPASAEYPSPYAQTAVGAQANPYTATPSGPQSPYGGATPSGSQIPYSATPSGAQSPFSQPPVGSRAAQVTQPIATQTGAGEKNRSLLYTGLGVAAVALLCVIIYVFLAKTEPGVVQLTTHPADAEVLFDGKPVGTASPFLVTGVAPGERHVLEVRKKGYRTWSQEVQVTPGQTLSFPVTLQPSDQEQVASGEVGGFSLETLPPGAQVFLDGQELSGVTPLRVGNLPPGSYKVGLRLNGYREQTLTVNVRSGSDESLPRVALEPERLRVRVTSEPPGAEAIVRRGSEERSLGKTPVDVTLENNGTPWKLEVSKAGFEPYERTLASTSGENELSVRAVLARSAIASSDSSSSAPVARPSPAPRPSTPIARPAAAPSSGGGTGILRINSRPWSQVYVDGKLVGNTPQMNVKLSAGTHKITLVNPDFKLRKNISVTIAAGETQTQIVSLQ